MISMNPPSANLPTIKEYNKYTHPQKYAKIAHRILLLKYHDTRTANVLNAKLIQLLNKEQTNLII